MENTQSFNTPKGIVTARADFHQFQAAYKAKDHPKMAKMYEKIYEDSWLFPPCNVVNSLRDDLTTYQTQNILNDLQVIANDRKKIRY